MRSLRVRLVAALRALLALAGVERTMETLPRMP